MIPVGGNTTVTIQIKTNGGKNVIGESVESWETVGTVLGWLDYQSGQNNMSQFNAKLQDTSHLFVCDYCRWIQGVTPENSRLVYNGEIYNVLMIDNPMNLNQHIEVYLQYLGGGLGV